MLGYDETIEGWAKALELRDHETQGHSRRVTDLAIRVARTMGVADEDLLHIRRGALLHDIGKLGVPDAILLKPGKLDADEWTTMKLHTTYAGEWLSPIAFLRPALDIPVYNHEKWDGTGYPRGLRAETIPLAARIFAVVDVWDALRSDRPYKSAWPAAEALDHIRSESGKHFDPKAVAALERVLREDAAATSARSIHARDRRLDAA
jgi:putative nucleotidyltransferase with HDIG domain